MPHQHTMGGKFANEMLSMLSEAPLTVTSCCPGDQNFEHSCCDRLPRGYAILMHSKLRTNKMFQKTLTETWQIVCGCGQKMNGILAVNRNRLVKLRRDPRPRLLRWDNWCNAQTSPKYEQMNREKHARTNAQQEWKQLNGESYICLVPMRPPWQVL